MKKLMSMIIVLIILTFSGMTYAMQPGQCWFVMERRNIAYGVVHDFVDVTCDRIPDIVQEYRFINGRMVPTQWWWL